MSALSSAFKTTAYYILLVVALTWSMSFIPTPRNLVEHAQQSCAIVETESGWGSAVPFQVRGADRIFFLTAKHVVEKHRDLHIRVESHCRGFKAGYFTVPTRIVMLSSGCDAAILTIPPVQWNFEGARIERDLPRVGDEVLAVGNMHGASFDNAVSQGIIAQLGVHPPEEFFPGFPWAVVDQTTAINLPGSSGGPVFSSHSGKLLGIQVGNSEGAVFLYLPSRVLLAFAHAEGWGWLFGDGKITESQLTELMSKVPALEPAPAPITLQQLLSLPIAPPQKHNGPDLKGHR